MYALFDAIMQDQAEHFFMGDTVWKVGLLQMNLLSALGLF